MSMPEHHLLRGNRLKMRQIGHKAARAGKEMEYKTWQGKMVLKMSCGYRRTLEISLLCGLYSCVAGIHIV